MFNMGAATWHEPITLQSGDTQGKAESNSEKSAQTSRTFDGKAFQVGTASWYGEQYDGKTTASGERFDMHDFTAAHPTLRFGTYVRVTNLKNGRAVIIRVNDRGPLVHGHIIDLSYAAARVLDFKREGVQRVRLDF